MVTEAPSSTNPSPHAVLAAARAWHAIAEQNGSELADAISAARSGIEELGREYRPRGIKDDTELQIAAAEERIAEGASDVGARMLIDVLAQRVGLYPRRHPTVRR